MVFGLQKLQDELFCMTEERNYFQGKYTEQVSEIAALKEELRKARKEINKLRGELMDNNSNSLLQDGGSAISNSDLMSFPQTPQTRRGGGGEEEEEKKEPEDGENNNNNNNDTEDNHAEQQQQDEEDYEDDDEDKEATEIRQSAEKLLQWAQYRSSYSTPVRSTSSPSNASVASGHSHTSAASSPVIPRTIESSSEALLEQALAPSISQESAPVSQESTELEAAHAAAISPPQPQST